MLPCIGDLHIDALETHIPESHLKILSTFDKVIDSEAKRGISAIVQLGDVFDNADPEQEHVRAFTKSLRRHPKISKHIIMGNHDFADRNNYALKLVRWFFKIGFINGKVYTKPEVVEIDDERYFFCPHPYVMDQPKKVRYSFGHFGFNGARGDNGYALKSDNNPKGRWVLGDYHTPQRGKTYIYAGSLCQVKFHEGRDKGYIRIEENPKFIKIKPDIILDRANITSLEDLQALDPDVYWSVNISRKAKLPPDWATKYPQVIRHHTEKAVSKRAQILMKQVASEDPLEGLTDYLRNEGMPDKDIKRGYKLLGRTDVRI